MEFVSSCNHTFGMCLPGEVSVIQDLPVAHQIIVVFALLIK